MAKCPLCGQKKSWFGRHVCINQRTRGYTVPASSSPPSSATSDSGGDGDFATSMAIGYATDNPILGGIIGGSMIGGIVGASLNTSDDHKPAADVDTPSSDYDASSYDSGSGGDGGSGGGGD